MKIKLLILFVGLVFLLTGCKAPEKPEATKTPIVAETPDATSTPEKTPTPEPTEEPVYPTVEPGTGKYHGGIVSEDPYKYEAFDVTTHGSTAIHIRPGDSAALQFFATTSFDESGFICPSMSDNIGSLTLKLYAWMGTYAKTVEQEPLHEKTFVDFSDNSWLVLQFDPLPDGEYLLVAEDPEQDVGVWKTIPDWDAVRTWINGVPVEGVIKNYIRYTNTPKNLYYQITDVDF